MSPIELKALVSLVNDDDPQISKHVEEKIVSLGPKAIPFLEEERKKNILLSAQNRIQELLHTLQYQLLKDRLKEWYYSEEQDLLTGMWLIASYEYPNLELENLKHRLEQLYYEVWLEFGPNLYPIDQIKIINSVFFYKLKFLGDTKNFYWPENSMINTVLEHRKGNPITLSVVYLWITQKLKLPIQAVSLSSLLLLVYKDDNYHFYINVFNRGLIFTKKDIENYINELNLTNSTSFYKTCTNLEIIRSSLQHLVIAFENQNEHFKAEEVKSLLVEISDGDILDF